LKKSTMLELHHIELSKDWIGKNTSASQVSASKMAPAQENFNKKSGCPIHIDFFYK